MLYTFRIDLELEQSDDLATLCARYSTKYAITHEISAEVQKSHFHGLIELASQQAFRLKLKSFFKLSQIGKPLSITPVKDEEKYMTYILKDGNLVGNTLYSSEQIQVFLDNVTEFKEQVKKKIKVNTIDRLIDGYENNSLHYKNSSHERQMYDIYTYIHKEVQMNKLKCSNKHLKTWMEQIHRIYYWKHCDNRSDDEHFMNVYNETYNYNNCRG